MLLITPKSGESVRIAESSLVAGKVVPAAPARRRGPAASFEELARVAARGLAAAWRASRSASGRCGRPPASPGGPTPCCRSATRVCRWTRRWRGSTRLVRGPWPARRTSRPRPGAEGTQELLCAELERRGWAARGDRARCGSAALAPVGDLDADAAAVRLSRDAGRGVARRATSAGRRPEARAAEGAGRRALGVVRDGAAASADGRRPRRSGGAWWTGAGPASRRSRSTPRTGGEGLATAVMAALARRALEEGASAAWLQVEADNAGARALYDGMGFATHHRYHHFRPA